jgi:hypothetical protein
MMRQRHAAVAWLAGGRRPRPAAATQLRGSRRLLFARDRANWLGSLPESGTNPNQFGHATIVRAHVCRQPRLFASTLRAAGLIASVMQFV